MVALPKPEMQTVEAIYRAYELNQKTEFRAHLGASSIGHECDRHIWMTFRWGAKQAHPGRILRLFDTGNLAEARFVNDLRMVGVQVLEIDPATGKQWTVRDQTGHYGGSLDALAMGFPEAPNTVHVCEFKTHNSKSFNDLVKKGVELSKPMHFMQMQAYMHLGGWTRAFYLAVNKDTDELYQERIRYDATLGMKITARAQNIIKADHPPIKISEDPSFYICKMCRYSSVCHGDSLPERHCRSCLSATPTDGGKWHCVRHGKVLEMETQLKGCYMHRYIPSIIVDKGFHQIDAGINGEWVTYVSQKSGVEWKDQGI